MHRLGWVLLVLGPVVVIHGFGALTTPSRFQKIDSRRRPVLLYQVGRPIPSLDPTVVNDKEHDELFVLGEKCRIESVPTISEADIINAYTEWLMVDKHNDYSMVEGELVPIEQGLQEEVTPLSWINAVMESYVGPRLILAAAAALYGTNFCLGARMAEALPPSVVTACRMTLAALSLAPFVFQISPKLLNRAVFAGCCTATGYVAQSLALVDTDPARVSFLGAATVLWTPILENFVDQRPMGWRYQPQTWMACLLCLCGVGVLELVGAEATSSSLTGDALSLLQAVGFGTGCFLSAKLVREEDSNQVLPVTAVMITTTAVLSWLWCAAAGTAVPIELVTDPNMRSVAAAVVWTGLISTSLNFGVEVSALRKVPASEASVILATEPVWAAIFAALLLGTVMEVTDYVGGALIVGACLVNALVKAEDVHRITGQVFSEDDDKLQTD